MLCVCGMQCEGWSLPCTYTVLLVKLFEYNFCCLTAWTHHKKAAFHSVTVLPHTHFAIDPIICKNVQQLHPFLSILGQEPGQSRDSSIYESDHPLQCHACIFYVSIVGELQSKKVAHVSGVHLTVWYVASIQWQCSSVPTVFSVMLEFKYKHISQTREQRQ